MNFILLARDKTKKSIPISHRIINYQTFLVGVCIIVYQFIQGQFPYSDNPLEQELRDRERERERERESERASVPNESTLVNYKIVLE